MRKFWAFLGVGVLGWGGIVAGATSPMVVGSAISGVEGTDFLIWEQTSPTTLGLNGSLNTPAGLTGIVDGNAGAVGGNVELFANSETGGITLPLFAVQAPVTLSGTVGGYSLTMRSLNGVDWFANPLAPAYGVGDRANAWFGSFMTAYDFDNFLATNLGYNAGQVATEKLALFTGFVGAGGFQRLSDPNISYAYYDTSDALVHIGMAGSDDYLNQLVAGYVIAKGRPDLVPLLPQNIRASEVVAATVDGDSEQFLWGFTGTPTGLVTTDTTESYATNFEVTLAPEPATLGVLVMGAAGLLIRRRRA